MAKTCDMLVKGIDHKLKCRFRAECEARGLTMQTTIQVLMDLFVKGSLSVEIPRPVKRTER